MHLDAKNVPNVVVVPPSDDAFFLKKIRLPPLATETFPNGNLELTRSCELYFL